MHAGPVKHPPRQLQHVRFQDEASEQVHSANDQSLGPQQVSASSNASSPELPDVQATIVEPAHVTVPLSSVPAAALELSTASGPKHRSVSDDTDSSAGSSTAATAASGKTGRLSQVLAAERQKASEVRLRINHPRQVTSLPTRYHKALAWVGRIGWVGKAVVYAMIGGLACQSAVGNDRPDPTLLQTEQISASPQGAFVLLSTTGAQGISIVILLVMMVALLAYITWRFWEGLAGQGYDETFSSKKNFFKFRLSPLVSGAVYVSYLVFLINVLDRQVRHLPTERGVAKEGWPATWRHSPGGRVGLALLGIAFVIATCIQLQGVLTRQWHRDYRYHCTLLGGCRGQPVASAQTEYSGACCRCDLPRPLMTAVFTIGHFGFAGRAGAFLAMAILFFKDAGGAENAPHGSSMVANALLQLQSNRGLRAVLMIIGVLLVVYGLFAVLSAATRMFPTPPPSRRTRLTAEQYKKQNAGQQQQQQQQEGQQAVKRSCPLPWVCCGRGGAAAASVQSPTSPPGDTSV